MPPSSAAGFTRRPSTPPSRLLPRRVVAFVVLGPQVLLQGQLSLAAALQLRLRRLVRCTREREGKNIAGATNEERSREFHFHER
jgi:hypothetical protein